MTIGQRIREQRKNLNMSVDELAKRLGKNRATIYRYEKGEIENLPLDVLEPIAKALETSPAWIMGWDTEQIDAATEIEKDKNKDISKLDEMYDEWMKEKPDGIASYIKSMRLEKHFTLFEMSEELGIPAELLKEYESGVRKIPYSVVKKMAEYFNVKLELLYGIEFETDDEKEVQAGIRRLKMAERWNKEFGKIVFSESELDEIINFTKYLVSKRKNNLHNEEI